MNYKKCPFCGAGVHARKHRFGGWFIEHLIPKPNRALCDAVGLPAFQTEEDAEKEWNMQFQFLETCVGRSKSLPMWCRHMSRGTQGDWIYSGNGQVGHWNFCPKCGSRRPRE